MGEAPDTVVIDCAGRWLEAVERDCQTVTKQVTPWLCYLLDIHTREIVGARILDPSRPENPND